MALFTTFEQDEYFRRKEKEARDVEFERLLRETGGFRFTTLSPKRKTLFKAAIVAAALLGALSIVSILSLRFAPGLCFGIASAISIAFTAPRLVPKK